MSDTHSEILRQRTRFHPIKALAGFLLLPTALIFALAVFGHPGLRISYTWNGSEAHPRFYHCEYITFIGWKKREVHCPLVELFPLQF